MTPRNRRRNLINDLMLTLTGVCAFVTVSMLFLILGYLVYNGGKSVDLNFFTKLPLPTRTRRRGYGERNLRKRGNNLDRVGDRAPHRFLGRGLLIGVRRQDSRVFWSATPPIC